MLKNVPAWARFLIVGLLMIVPYVWFSDGPLQQFWYDAVATAGVAAMAVGIRRNRPEWAAGWWLLVVGQALNVLGDGIYFYVYNVLHHDAFPAPYDIPYLLSYVLMVLGLLSLLRRRNHGRDRAGLVDSLILASAFALLSWVFLMRPVAEDKSLGLLGQFVAMAYPTLDLLVLAMLAWLLTSDGPRNVAFLLVTANMVGFLVGDYFWAFAQQTMYNPSNLGSRLIDCAYLVAYVCFGAGALHPGMVQIGRPVGPDRLQSMTVQRLVLLAAATLIAPALLAWQAWHGHGQVHDAYAIVLGCVVMFLLVVARMMMLVRQVQAQAVVLEEQADRLREVAQQDPLTGLPNRRAWNAALPAALQRAARDGTPLTLAVLDLDHFKQFNDAYGHQAGDQLLKEVAVAWADNLRAVDLVARYGGEEFVVLLPGATAAEAVALLDRLRPRTPTGCTFSAGVATWNGAESADELVARADRALYRAKDAGRARIECAEATVTA
ncbi:GGDEF domain-containing protein [Planosporangium thailandense]|uniref:GGDEF domain-containing protein n=1 Tax=Planosporangium thailandense TaxID=765197 RepID=A0ABX0XUV7_9ACTN|nr:GGDEF domain-containing protein [Planosporangium thailandense]NJC69826.1 GGDEF domain-containing protein [Planosporangium thailandense]